MSILLGPQTTLELDHGWPESRTSQARSAQRCRMRSFSLHEAFVKQARDSTRQGALRKLVGASWSGCSTQVALCKLLCASCSAQVVQLALRKLLCASCFKMPVASCDARPRTREESNPRPAGSGSRRANHETTPEDQFEQQKSRKSSSFCTSTTPIPAEGCASTAEIAKNHGFLNLDHADPRRGLREHRRNRKKKPWVFAPRPRRSPQRVARACWKSQKTSSFCTSTTLISAEGRASTAEITKKPWVFAPRPRRSPQRVARACWKSQNTSSFCTSTTPIPAEGCASTAEIAKNHGFLNLDHANPRRGWREHRAKSQKKTMGFCTSTTPIPAEGRAGTLDIAKNHGFLHLDHADPRRGSIFV